MPIESVPDEPGTAAPAIVNLPRGPEFSDIIGPALRQNSVVSVLSSMMRESFPEQEGYSPPWDEIRRNPDYLDHAEVFAAARSPEQFNQLRARIDQKNNDERMLAASGAAGAVASIVAQGVDVPSLLPGSIAIRALRTGAAAVRPAVRGAIETGLAGAAGAAAQDVALRASQPYRDPSETVMSVASATILGGLLGSAMSWLSPAERASAIREIDHMRAQTDAHAAGQAIPPSPLAAKPAEPFPIGTSALPVPTSAGAAATEQRTLEGMAIAPGLGLEKTRAAPGFTMMRSESPAARMDYADLVEIPVRVKGNLAGQITTSGEAPLQTTARTQLAATNFRAWETLRDAWMDLAFGGKENAPRAAVLRSWISSRRGATEFAGGAPTFEAFKDMVGFAMRYGDKHDIPQVQKAAEELRSIFDHWSGRGEKSVEGFHRAEQREGESYFPHDWDKPLISARRNLFVNNLTNEFFSNQAAKRAAQDRLRNYQSSLESRQQSIDRLTNQLESRQNALERDITRAEEVQRFNKFAFKRSEDLSKPLDEARERIRTIEAKIEPHLGRLEQLGEDIKEEKVKFPEIREADALIFKMIGAAQKLKQSKELIDAVEAAGEYVEEVDKLIGGFKGGIREASEAAKEARTALGADTLVSLEKSRADLKKEIKPWLTALKKARDELAEEQKTRGPLARGGAVFETMIRERGNILGERLSGRRAEIEDIENRLQNEHAHAAQLRDMRENEVLQWRGKLSKGAKTAILAREKYKVQQAAEREPPSGGYAAAREPKERRPGTGRLTSADRAVDDAVAEILASDRNLPVEHWRDVAHQTTEHILGSPAGRLPFDENTIEAQTGVPTPNLRGSLAKRTLDVSNAFAEKWIHRDPEKVINTYLRSIVPDVLLSEKFGDVNMTQTFRKIDADYQRLVDAAPPGLEGEKRATALGKQQNEVKAIMAMDRDLLRGVYQVPGTAAEKRFARTASALKNANVILDMGMSALASLQDAAGPVFRHGMLAVYKDAYLPFIRGLMSGGAFPREAARQLHVMGIALDTKTAARHHSLNSMDDGYAPLSKFETVLQSGANLMQIMNGLAGWTDWQKTMAGSVAMSEIYRAAKAQTKGNATAKQLANLAESNIQPHIAERIVEQYEKSGNRVDGVLLPNTENWDKTPAAQEARRMYEAAIARDVDISVVTPSSFDKPVWMHDRTWSVLGQFKSYTAGATTRTLMANLQRADAQSLQGVLVSIGLGAIGYKINSVLTGKPTSDNPSDWVKESISRGNLLGWLEEGNTVASKMTRGEADLYRLIGAKKPLSRFAAGSAVDHLLGPTVGKMEKLSKVTGAASTGEWNDGDVTAFRNFVPGSKLPYLRGLFDQVQSGAENAFGIPLPPERKPERHSSLSDLGTAVAGFFDYLNPISSAAAAEPIPPKGSAQAVRPGKVPGEAGGGGAGGGRLDFQSAGATRKEGEIKPREIKPREVKPMTAKEAREFEAFNKMMAEPREKPKPTEFDPSAGRIGFGSLGTKK